MKINVYISSIAAVCPRAASTTYIYSFCTTELRADPSTAAIIGTPPGPAQCLRLEIDLEAAPGPAIVSIARPWLKAD